MSVEATLLKDGNVGNYNSAYNQALFTLSKDNVGTDWRIFKGSITVPDSFDGTASSSNIGIVFEAVSYTHLGLCKSVGERQARSCGYPC